MAQYIPECLLKVTLLIVVFGMSNKLTSNPNITGKCQRISLTESTTQYLCFDRSRVLYRYKVKS